MFKITLVGGIEIISKRIDFYEDKMNILNLDGSITTKSRDLLYSIIAVMNITC